MLAAPRVDQASPSYEALLRTSQELSIHASELDVAVARDEAGRARRAFLSQRRPRLAGALLLGVLSVWLAPSGALTVVALGASATVAAYAAMLWLAVRVVGDQRTNDATRTHAITSLLVTDAIALTAFGFLAGGEAAALSLIPGLVLAASAAFFFGRRDALVAGLVVAGGYVATVLLHRVALGGVQPTWRSASAQLVVFVASMVVTVRVFAEYRRRINALRMYCKLGELGEAPVTIPIDAERAPDDLTLLAGSIDAMRWRLGEQVGSDPLTGCANRRTLESRLITDWRHAKRRKTGVALAAIDVDHFKQINDTRGHPVGDLVLQQVASIMLTNARDTDTVARLGGDEFVIVLPDTDREGAVVFAERLRTQVMDFTFGPSGDPLGITISVGVAIVAGSESIEPAQLMTAADRSLYRAKAAGRNRVCD